MPIKTQHPITALTEKQFHKLDYDIMAMAFELHNELGRFYDEVIYKDALKQMCIEQGLDVTYEAEIKLIHEQYTKSLFIDLLIENSVYELKTTKAIHDANRTQALNYLFSTNTQHGKIINFRPSSVEYSFISTTLNHHARKQINMIKNDWVEKTDTSHQLRLQLENILSDWGAYLDHRLYEDALIHMLGGTDSVVKKAPILKNGKTLGHQKLNTLSDSEIFVFSSYKKQLKHASTHLSKMLKHTQYNTLYWINFNQSDIEFTTLGK